MPLQSVSSLPHAHVITTSSSDPPEQPKDAEPAHVASQGDPQDAFHLEGFFPRSDSYYSLSSLNGQWVRKEEEDADPSSPTTTLSSSSHDPVTPGLGNGQPYLILTPAAHDDHVSSEITQEDHVGGLVSTAAKVVTLPIVSSSTAFAGPSYDHDHLIHSYDFLHSSLSDRRRSATVPDLAAYHRGQRRKANMYDVREETGSQGKGGVEVVKWETPKLTLFSPEEEKIDYWGAEPGDGEDERRMQEPGDSWATYIYEHAKRLWIRKPELKSLVGADEW